MTLVKQIILTNLYVYKFEKTFKPVSFIILENKTGALYVLDIFVFVNKMVKNDTLK